MNRHLLPRLSCAVVVAVVVLLLLGSSSALAEEKPAKWQSLWADLASSDEGTAARALLALASAPKETLKLFQEQLKPVKADARRVKQLIDELDSDEFDKRQSATEELAYLGKSVKETLEKALEKASSPEVKKRLADLLAKIPNEGKAAAAAKKPPALKAGRGISVRTVNGEVQIYIDGKPLDLSPRVIVPPGPNPAWVRATRAIALLESMKTAEARKLLEKLADGEAEAGPTKQAKAALERLDR